MLSSSELGLPVGHVTEADAPWVRAGDIGLRLLHVDIARGVWVIANRFPPGYTVVPHQHTGCVHAWTTAGCWRYLEYGIDYTAGSYVHEPAGSRHTLHVPTSNTVDTEVFFVIEGANLNLDEAGNVVSITDAASISRAYEALRAMSK
jgi:quercetin dioxygenase-like cupin family protein